MHIVHSALYRAENHNTYGAANGKGTAADAFSGILGLTLDGQGGKNGIAEALNRLRERFPGLRVEEGEAGTDIGDAKQPDPAATETDTAAISQPILAGMSANASLAQLVEDILAGLLERGSENNLMHLAGATVQRSLTITYTQVRYTEFHRDGASGDLLGAADLKTAFHDRLTSLIRKFFGDGETADAEATEAKTGTARAASSVAMWSLEIYYSAAAISGAADFSRTGDGSGQAAWQYTSLGASIRNAVSGVIPSAIRNAGGGLAAGDGDAWSRLETTLAGYGLAVGTLRLGNDGFMTRLLEGRNLLAELMELYGGKITGKPLENPEETGNADAPTDAESVLEGAVAAV